MRIKVGILGATGYTGAELLRLLSSHPEVSLEWLTSEKFAGRKISAVFPHLRGFTDLECSSVAELKGLGKVDAAFSCLPQGSSMHFTARLHGEGVRVVDFSADFRFRDPAVYEKLYGLGHKHKDLIEGAVYGLPELFRDKIRSANLVANPGCFATGVILGLCPLLSEGLVDTASVIADAKSGASGGGRAPSLQHHFPESNENVRLNLPASFSQGPEMEDALSRISGAEVGISFMSHTLSINRGILTTIYTRPRETVTPEYISELYEKYYGLEPFVRLYGPDTYPELKDVRHTNVCGIGLHVRHDTLVTVTALDNLVKGASGQAVQNMNIMFGFKETESLVGPGLFP